MLIFFSCKEKIDINKKIKYISLSFNYNENIKIREKILLKKEDKKFLIFNDIDNTTDLSTDKKEEVKTSIPENKDLTDEGLVIEVKRNKKENLKKDKDLYIYKEKDIDCYEKKLRNIEEIFIFSFRERFKKYGIKVNETTDEIVDNSMVAIEVKILNYNPGEFNRIKNINTELNISFTIKNKELKFEKRYQKKMIAKAIPELPTEKIRIKDIADRYALFFEQEIAKIRINETNIKGKNINKEKDKS